MRRISRAVANHSEARFYDNVKRLSNEKRCHPTKYADFEFREMERKEHALDQAALKQRAKSNPDRQKFWVDTEFQILGSPGLATR